jgi:hypothetical protein
MLRKRLVLDALISLLAIGGITLVAIGGRPADPPTRVLDDAPVPGPPRTLASATPPSAGPPRLGPSTPVRLDIPAIGVSTALTPVGLNADGTIEVPPLRSNAPAGWYRFLPTPGEVGPAVILGHVDTARDGPAVFYRLQELRPGDTVSVHRTDGSTAVFAVRQVTEYPKSAFPTAAVYGAVDYPALRLITCGGSFDQVKRQYRGNVVVYAALL